MLKKKIVAFKKRINQDATSEIQIKVSEFKASSNIQEPKVNHSHQQVVKTMMSIINATESENRELKKSLQESQ